MKGRARRGTKAMTMLALVAVVEEWIKFVTVTGHLHWMELQCFLF
jgi:hypothetical protein